MKKLFCLALSLFLVLCLVGCTVEEPLITFDYIGSPITSITYRTADYMGGGSCTTTIDFVSNTTTRTTTSPNYSDESGGYYDTETEIIGSFTDEAEKKFINQIYSLGFFTILPRYEPPYTVMDGSGWTLVVEYENGGQKRSSGSNAAPDVIFSLCAIPFYRLTGIDVLGRVPTEYKYPPNISYTLNYGYDNYDFNVGIHGERANYRWNNHTVSGKSIYDMTVESIEEMYGNPLNRSLDYSLVIYTSNYKTDEYDVFKSIEIRSYNIDPDLTDEKLVYSSGWFTREEISLELDRIYLVTIEFYNGDYAEYIFNTYSSDQKVFYGFYSCAITDVGDLRLEMYEDAGFELSQFIYYDREAGGYPYSTPSPISGSWAFETIDGAEYLVLTAEDGERLVLEYTLGSLTLNKEKTTLDFRKHQFSGISEDNNQNIIFRFCYYTDKRYR